MSKRKIQQAFEGNINTPLLVSERANRQKVSTDRKIKLYNNKVVVMNII